MYDISIVLVTHEDIINEQYSNHIAFLIILHFLLDLLISFYSPIINYLVGLTSELSCPLPLPGQQLDWCEITELFKVDILSQMTCAQFTFK